MLMVVMLALLRELMMMLLMGVVKRAQWLCVASLGGRWQGDFRILNWFSALVPLFILRHNDRLYQCPKLLLLLHDLGASMRSECQVLNLHSRIITFSRRVQPLRDLSTLAISHVMKGA